MSKGRFNRKKERVAYASKKDPQNGGMQLAPPAIEVRHGRGDVKLKVALKRARAGRFLAFAGRPFWFAFGTLFGVLFGLYFVPWYVALLPGPHVVASVQGLRITKGNPIGCTAYMFTFSTDRPLEYVYGKLQFPNRVDDAKFGYPEEAITRSSDRMAMQVTEFGKSPTGQCRVVQTAIDNHIGIESSMAGNMVGFSASKVPPKGLIEGEVVTEDGQSSANALADFYSEGEYDYLNLGQSVRKPLAISFAGTVDPKE